MTEGPDILKCNASFSQTLPSLSALDRQQLPVQTISSRTEAKTLKVEQDVKFNDKSLFCF